MGDIGGFIKYAREDFSKEPPESRKKHWKEFIRIFPEEKIREQAARCMECGIPFCHWGCPVANLIPDWNDLVFKGRWEEAYQRLAETNNFSEITGRVCPAPCENSCVLAFQQKAVSIKNIELSIIERAFQEGWVRARVPSQRTGKTVAVIGSGPAGLACADQLNQAGHLVTVFEKSEEPGGILAFGIPDFKLEKWVLQRRISLLKEEGIIFRTGTSISDPKDVAWLRKNFDALVLTGGAEQPRDLKVPGRELKGVYQAMEFLTQQNRVNRGQTVPASQRISAKDKHVVVLGGGDTGSDCVGTAHRQGAKSVKQFEILPCPPRERTPTNPWPQWAFIYRTSTSQEEGVEQEFCVMTKALTGQAGRLKKLQAVRLEYGPIDPLTCRYPMTEVPHSEFSVDCDLLLLAMGFVSPVTAGMISQLGLELDPRGNVKTDDYFMSSVEGVFSAGDMRRGQSLVVWAIQEGREAAKGVNQWLMNK